MDVSICLHHGTPQRDTKSSQRCTGLKTLLSDHERCQENTERGENGVPDPWIEVTIIPVDRLEIVHLEKSLWRGKILICKRRSWVWKDRILLASNMAASLDGHRMSVGPRRQTQAARFPSPLQAMHEDEDMSFEEPQMSEWSGGSCRKRFAWSVHCRGCQGCISNQ